ncbi:MAG: DegT/DnrJ/EryC1/StrS family aminotransferase [Spirochaetes bacterium]|nr:DegT/DnrJ/EryC1/StrS family aminotransferase [Spirochaetota bacterium]
MKFMDLHAGYLARKEKMDARIASVISRSQFIFGPELTELEETLAKYSGSRYAAGVSSGMDGLLIALMALGLSPENDNRTKEVIVPAFTFIATAEAVAFLGAKPVFVDIDEKTYNIDASKIEASITKSTVGIIPVDLFGQCADYDKISAIAKKHNLFVIEDACQAFGAARNGRKACSFGDIAVTSFFPAKPLGCFGDGGMVFTDNEKLINDMKMIRHHGEQTKYHHTRIGMTGRLDNLQAAVLLEKFNGFDADMSERRKRAAIYNAGLAGSLTVPVIDKGNESVYAQYCIRSPKRAAIIEGLGRNGIPTAIYYPKALHLMECFANLGYKKGDMPVSEKVSEDIFALPIYNEMPKEDQDTVIKELKALV